MTDAILAPLNRLSSARSRPAKALKRMMAAALATLAFSLAGCATNGNGNGTNTGDTRPPVAPPTSIHTQLPDTPTGVDTKVQVAILLPFSHSQKDTRTLAASLLNAAQLALFDANNPNIELIPIDTKGSPGEAAAAANSAIAQGAEIILGPVFAEQVTAVAPIARLRNVPVIAFSTDTSVAGNGVYLLSFAPEEEVRRIVTYAASQGLTNIAALFPASPYGNRVSLAFSAAAIANGVSVAATAIYPQRPEEMNPAVESIAGASFQAVLLPEGGQLLRALGPILPFNNIDPRAVRFLGTGLWDEAATAKEPALVGGWFAAPEPTSRQTFADRYRTVYDSRAPRVASLGYDAMALATVLAREPAGERYTLTSITDPNGFLGVDGIFRFKADGTLERGLAVVEVTNGGFTVVSPAPRTFEPSAF